MNMFETIARALDSDTKQNLKHNTQDILSDFWFHTKVAKSEEIDSAMIETDESYKALLNAGYIRIFEKKTFITNTGKQFLRYMKKERV